MMHGTADTKNLGFLPDRLDRIGAHIQSAYLDTGKLPFASVLVGRGEEIAYQWRSGVGEDAIFRIASMTKPITCIAFMQLVEQGKVALSDPVANIFLSSPSLGCLWREAAMYPLLRARLRGKCRSSI